MNAALAFASQHCQHRIGMALQRASANATANAATSAERHRHIHIGTHIRSHSIQKRLPICFLTASPAVIAFEFLRVTLMPPPHAPFAALLCPSTTF